jgi:hypothetical protein
VSDKDLGHRPIKVSSSNIHLNDTNNPIAIDINEMTEFPSDGKIPLMFLDVSEVDRMDLSLPGLFTYLNSV